MQIIHQATPKYKWKYINLPVAEYTRVQIQHVQQQGRWRLGVGRTSYFLFYSNSRVMSSLGCMHGNSLKKRGVKVHMNDDLQSSEAVRLT